MARRRKHRAVSLRSGGVGISPQPVPGRRAGGVSPRALPSPRRLRARRPSGPTTSAWAAKAKPRAASGPSTKSNAGARRVGTSARGRGGRGRIGAFELCGPGFPAAGRSPADRLPAHNASRRRTGGVGLRPARLGCDRHRLSAPGGPCFEACTGPASRNWRTARAGPFRRRRR